MKVVRSSAALTAALASERIAGRTVAFVPTMGALHEGHLSLLRRARDLADVVVLSIFVNPLQFGPGEDLASYPRDEAADLVAAEDAKADVVFIPTAGEIYPESSVPTVETGALGDVLEGAERPGHFAGVATVVARLFALVQPDIAIFGQKDAQQVAVVKQMVRDLGLDVAIEVAATVRAEDGVALSSRNAHLTAAERAHATALWRALQSGAARLEAGDGPRAAERSMLEVLTAEDDVGPGYTVAVDPDSFAPKEGPGPVLLLVTARVGTTRLIDNLLVQPTDTHRED
jgi:pantoate--beta-alanine ligase